jgi:hypothetical protein
MIRLQTIILVSVLTLTGCTVTTSEQTGTIATPTTAAVTDAPTTATSPRPVLPTATVERLPFPEVRIAESLLLSEGHSVKCELPCWQALDIGKSTEQDVQAALRDTFESREGFEFFPPPETGGGFPERENVIGTQIGGYYWYKYIEAVERLGSYFLFAYLDENTGKLLGIQETMDSFETFELPRLNDIVVKLGVPEWIYSSRAGSTYVITMYYQEGIQAVIILWVVPEDLADSTDPLCLNDKPISVRISLVDQYSDPGEEGDSLLQTKWSKPEHPAPYIDRVLGNSIEEFIEFLNSENPCIEVPRS